jgi:excisionase family DNA binding protein
LRYLTTAEVADHLNCSTKTVGRLRANGKLPFLKLGDNIRFRLESVEALLQPGMAKIAPVKSFVAIRVTEDARELPSAFLRQPSRRAEAA